MSVSFEHYKVFYYTARLGNITQAADALYLTQPTVSHTIRLLEEELGCTLFRRSRKGVTMTPEAEKLFVHVSAAYEHIEKAEAELAAARNFQAGELRIGASETTLHHFLFSRLTAFKQSHPRVRYKVYSTTSPAALKDLSRGLLDLAVLVTPADYQNKTFSSRRLCSMKDVFLAGSAYEDLKGRPVSLRELAKRPIISMTEGTLTRDCLEQLFLSHHLTLRPDIELSSADLITPMVRDNLGVGFVPSLFAQAEIKQGSVFEIQLKESIPVREIRLFYHADRPLSLAAQAFADTL